MSYQVKYQLEHKTNINGTDVTYKLDILKDSWVGGVTAIKGDKSSGVFNLFTPDLNPRKPFDTPIQKGELELMLMVSDQLSYNGLDIIDEILAGEEDTFRMDLYIDDVKHWSGFILPDLMEYPEGEYVFSASIIAKDLTLMEDKRFPLVAEDSFESIIKIIADCLKQTGLNLPIQTHTNITASSLATDNNETEDFLKWFYHDQYAFRKFNNENADEKIPYTEVLEELLKKYNLILRQGNGQWIIEQLPAVAKGDALRFNYDANGVDTTVYTDPNDDIGNSLNRIHTIDSQNSFILPKSKNQIAQAIKRVEHSYNHRSQFVTLSIDDKFKHTEPTDTTSFQTSIEQDGDIKVRIDGSSLQLLQDNDLGFQTATAYMQLRVEGESPTRYWDRASDSWTTTETDIEYLFAGEGFVLSSSVFEVETTAIPQNLGNSNIIIEFKWADVTGSGNVEEILFEGFTSFLFTDNNIEKSERLDFTFERDGNYSLVDKMGVSLIGQGVSQFAKGAVATFFNSEIVLMEDIFRVRDGGGFLSLEHLLMRERMNFQRSYIRSLSMNLKANYSINQLISYRNELWFPLGYRLDGAESDNEVTGLQLNYQQGDFSDVYDRVIVMPETTSGSSSSSSAGSGASGSDGITEAFASTLFLRQDENGADIENASIFRTNLGLVIGTDIQAHSANLDTLAGNDGSNLTGLNATEIKSGTLPTGRLSGSYTGITGTGALNAGSITSGFGNIDIGSSTLNVGGQSTLDGSVVMNSGYLWNKNGVSYLSGGAIVGSSAVPTYDFEVDGNSHLKNGWLWISDDYVRADNRLGVGVTPWGPNRIGNSDLQVAGSVDVTGSIGFIKDTSTQQSSWRMYQGGDIPLLIVKNFNSPYSVMDIKGKGTDPADQTKNSESTLALFRGTSDESSSEFMDLFNNGYWNQGVALDPSVYMGIRIQKRGTGVYRPFKYQYSDGDELIEMLRINPPDDGNNVEFEVPIEVSDKVGLRDDTSGAVSWDVRSHVKETGAPAFMFLEQKQSEIAILEVVGKQADPTSTTVDGESTLTLMREGGGGAEFLDLYNNGYNDSKEYGLQIQSRGIGELRPFNFQFFDGTNRTTAFSISAPDASQGTTLDISSLVTMNTGLELYAYMYSSDVIYVDGGIENYGYFDQTGNATLRSNVYVGDATDTTDHVLETLNFALTTDFSGTGWTANDQGDFNINNLVVRESARFRELIIDELSIIAGSDLRSVARGKIKSVDPSTNTVTLENPNNKIATTWKEGDFFWVKSVDVDGGVFLDLKGQITPTGVNVDTTDPNDVIITLKLDTTVAGGTHETEGVTDISVLSQGNVMVQRGHPTDTDRQALIYTTVSDSDAPVQKYFTGIDSLGAFNDVSNTSLQEGVLDGLTGTYSNVSGEGLYSSNAFLTDSILIGDLSQVGSYLSYDSGGTLSAVLDTLDITAGGNSIIANDTDGVVINANEFTTTIDANNQLSIDSSGLAVKGLGINFRSGTTANTFILTDVPDSGTGYHSGFNKGLFFGDYQAPIFDAPTSDVSGIFLGENSNGNEQFIIGNNTNGDLLNIEVNGALNMRIENGTVDIGTVLSVDSSTNSGNFAGTNFYTDHMIMQSGGDSASYSVKSPTSTTANDTDSRTPFGFSVFRGSGENPIVTSGLESWWKLNEGANTTATDTQDTHTGSIETGTSWVSSPISAFQLERTTAGGFFSISNNNFWNGTEFSFSFWMNPYDLDNTENRFAISDWTSVAIEYERTFRDGIGLTLWQGGTPYLALSTAPLVENTLYHVVVTFSTTNGASIYIDGQLEGSTTADWSGGFDTHTGGDIFIGSKATGTMDQVRYYQREISSTEVQSLFNNPNGLDTPEGFNFIRSGRISVKDTTNNFSSNEWGVQLQSGKKDVMRVDSNGALIANLDVAGPLTMVTNGEITNGNNDFTINTDGLNLYNDSTGYQAGSAVTFKDNAGKLMDLYAFSDLGVISSTNATMFASGGAFRMSLNSDRLKMFSTPIELAKFTTTERDAISAQNGMLIYNTSTNTIQGYANGSWSDL